MPLADLLRVPLASEAVDAPAPPGGVRRTLPRLLTDLLPDAPGEWVEHDDIRVDGVSLAWRVVDGEVHACTVDGLARGVAWAAGRWELRALLAELLLDPGAAPVVLDQLLAEQELSPR